MAKDDKNPKGTSGIGKGLEDAAGKGEGAVSGGFRSHNADAADKTPDSHKNPKKDDKGDKPNPFAKKSYAAELGDALSAHAREESGRIRPS